MGKRNFGTDVICPYYKCEDGKKIYCEGVEDGATTHIVFPDKARLREFRASHCERFKNKCPLYKGLNEKWGYCCND